MVSKNIKINEKGGAWMRLDKYLKVSRLVKRRTLAKEVADKGRIEINGKVAKSSSTVKVNDELTLYYGNKILKVCVKDIKDSTKKQDAAHMYEIISEERVERPALDDVTGVEIFE